MLLLILPTLVDPAGIIVMAIVFSANEGKMIFTFFPSLAADDTVSKCHHKSQTSSSDKIDKTWILLSTSVTRLGDLMYFGTLFEAFGNN